MIKLTFIFIAAFFFSGSFAQNDPNCGTKGPRKITRIINGTETKPLEFPWMAYVSTTGVCGGTIISKNWILTAAHCVHYENGSLIPSSAITVTLGKYHETEPDDTNIQLNILKVIKYPTYVHDHTFMGDAALLKLERELKLDGTENYLGTICLPDKEDLDKMVGKDCIATGWGNIDHHENGTAPKVMMKMTTQIMKQSDCAKLNEESESFPDFKICTDTDKASACAGDSGGPLQCFIDGKWVEYGIDSYSRGDDCKLYPDVWGRTSELSAWIWGKIREN